MDSNNIVYRLQEFGRLSPSKPAVTFIDDKNNVKMLTYGALNQKVSLVAANLKKYAKKGERAILLLPQSLDFVICFYACLQVGVIAVPVQLPTNKNYLKKLEKIIGDCNPSLIIANLEATLTVKRKLRSKAIIDSAGLDGIKLALSELLVGKEYSGASWKNYESLQSVTATNSHGDIASDQIAFLQYTSGSTSDPKGVVISHKNIFNHAALLTRTYQFDAEKTMCGWVPFTHDMGLIGNLIAPLSVGGHLVFITPFHLIKQPYDWFKIISEYSVCSISCPPSILQYCYKKISTAEVAQLDLSSCAQIICGAEPIQPEILRKFNQHFQSAGIRENFFKPSYGLAEATLMVSAGEGVRIIALDKEQLKSNSILVSNCPEQGTPVISCGIPFQDVKIVKQGSVESVNEGEVGEVCISGLSVARGYWNNDAVNSVVFNQVIDGEEGYFRTGDLGFLYKKELYITGRIKELIIINGHNYYPTDVEYEVQNCHPLLSQSTIIAFSVARNSGEELIITVELGKNECDDLHAIERAIKATILSAFNLAVDAVIAVEKNSLTRTSSGKLQRSLCKQLYLKNELKVVEMESLIG